MTKVQLSRRAVKDLDSLPKKNARSMIAGIEKLAEEPDAPNLDVKLLLGRRPWRRLRVGNYRVLFRFYEGRREILVGRVFDRRELEKAIQTLPE